MKKHLVIMLGIIVSMVFLTACGKGDSALDTTSNSEQATATEKEASETKADKDEITKETYGLIEYEAGGMVMNGEQLAATGISNGTYVEMIGDGSGTVSIMGAANPMTWDDSGSIKINDYPVYSFCRVDADTIILEQAGVKYTMSRTASVDINSGAAGMADGLQQDYPDTYEIAKSANAAGISNGDSTTYYLYGYEAQNHVYDDFTDGAGESLQFSDFIGTTLTLNQDGTALFNVGGANTDTFNWSKEDGVIDSQTYTMEWLDEDKIALTQYGVLKYLLTSQERPDETQIRKKEGLKKASHPDNNKYGSCSYLNAPRTLLVSIYLSDDRAKWEDNERDQKSIADTLYMLKAGAAWLTNSVAEYGYDSEFLSDWELYPDLKYSVTYDGCFDDDESIERIRYNHSVGGNSENNQPEILRKLLPGLVDSEALKKKYDADNIAYIFLYNNWDNDSIDNFGALRSFGAYNNGGDEVVMLYSKWKNLSVIPHEVLHLFDAPDLYSDEYAYNSLVPSQYVSYLKENEIPDIMSAETKETYFGFNGIIGPATAYYVNLTDEKPEFEGYTFKDRNKD